MNRERTPEKKLCDMLVEVFGSDYLELVTNDKKKNDQHILSMKLDCIKSIMRSRIEMGEQPNAEMFDQLYDKNLYELQQLQVEFLDMQHYWEQSQKSRK